MSDNNKAQHIAEYIQSIAAIEECMEPYREQRKELRKNYIENKWLNKEDVSLAMKAFRMLQQKIDFEDLSAIYENLSYTLNGGNPQELSE
jgi:hypothetical protein|tara:strand:+ start:426 stop:695 length:270 start_codon:yes stop_codon:yes gene_type:complete